jgi:2-polyprenyl-3-methyl-5-hydroxy-6-metoxy-1,4-benzoquinol methylase
MSNERCPICTVALSVGERSWHSVCKGCGYEKGNLLPAINCFSSDQLIDEDARVSGLREIRMSNFKKLVARIKELSPNKGSLLDVGCGHGWFHEVAINDFKILALEPDKKIFAVTSRRGIPVRKGYFPEALDELERFDVIVFNDVIEHIPDIKSVLASCRHRLNKDGLLVLNLPSSNGVFYRLSKIICRFGFPVFFERLWQKNLPSPHLHYFNLSNVIALLRNNGFEIKKKGSLSTICLAGLYARITYIGNLGDVARICVYLCVTLFLPILKILPSDIIFVISKRK